MKIDKLYLWDVEENDGTLTRFGNNATVTIVNRHYSFDNNDNKRYLINEIEEITHTEYLGIKLKDKNVYRIRKGDVNDDNLYVKLSWFQALKYRLMFVSGKNIISRIFKGMSVIIGFILKVL